MRKVLFLISLLSVLTIGIIFILQKNTEDNHNNGFKRQIEPIKMRVKNSIKLPTKSFMFAGKIDTNIILTTNLNLLNFYKVDDSLNKMDTIIYNYPSEFNTDAQNIYKDAIPNYSFSTNPYGDIAVFGKRNGVSMYKINKFRFDFFQALSSTSLIVRSRTKSKDIENRSLSKLSLLKSVKIIKEYKLPNLQNGLFTNDGILLYDKRNARIFYMYFYRGEFLSLDTNLNLIYKAKTIDTVKMVKIKTRMITSKSFSKNPLRQLAPTTPPKFVNLSISVDNSYIFINSKLKSDNESNQSFESNQVIDVYMVKTGQYLHSFYVPHYRGLRFDQFQIHNQRLTTIYRPYIVSYALY